MWFWIDIPFYLESVEKARTLNIPRAARFCNKMSKHQRQHKTNHQEMDREDNAPYSCMASRPID